MERFQQQVMISANDLEYLLTMLTGRVAFLRRHESESDLWEAGPRRQLTCYALQCYSDHRKRHRAIWLDTGANLVVDLLCCRVV